MEQTITIKASACYAGTSSATGSYYNISSTDNMNGVSNPKASNLTWTFIKPSDVPWGAVKIKSAYVKNVRVYNSSSTVKDASWVFRTTASSSSFNGNTASINGSIVWRYHGMNNGSWHPKDTTTTYNNVTMTSNAIAWIENQLKAGKNLYFSYIEARSAGGSISSPNYSDSTYSTRFYWSSYYPSIVITYEVLPCYVFTNIRKEKTYPEDSMSSNSSQNCVVSASSTYSSNFPAYYAFDNNTSNAWCSSKSDTKPWIQIQLPKQLYSVSVTLKNRVHSSYNIGGFIAGYISVSKDGSNWTTILNFSGRNGSTSGYSNRYSLNNNTVSYSYIRITATSWDKTHDTYASFDQITIKGYDVPASGEWQTATAYIYTDGAWKTVAPRVYTNSEWNPS